MPACFQDISLMGRENWGIYSRWSVCSLSLAVIVYIHIIWVSIILLFPIFSSFVFVKKVLKCFTNLLRHHKEFALSTLTRLLNLQ